MSKNDPDMAVAAVLFFGAPVLYIVAHVYGQKIIKKFKKQASTIKDYCENRGWNWVPVREKTWHDLPSLWQKVSDDYEELFPNRWYVGATVQILLRGEIEGISFEAFQFSHGASGRHSSPPEYITVFSIVQQTPSGSFDLSEANLGNKIAQFFGGQDVKVGLGEFDERFRLQSDDEVLIKELFHPGTTELCLRERDLRLVGVKDRFILVRVKQMDVEDLAEMSEFLHRFWDEIPEGWRREGVRENGG